MNTENTETKGENKAGFLDPKSNVKALVRILIIVAVLIGGIWVFLRFTAGKKVADVTTATILRQPIELKDSIESIKASSWKGFPVSLPYAGTLLVELNVRNGNAIDVFVMGRDEIENFKSKKPFNHVPEFEAQKTKTYRRSARLAAGAYYVVMVDKTLGLLSASSSDVQVHAKLEP
jgi:hypothetical protein